MKPWNSSITELRIARFYFAYVQQFAVLIINTINSLLTHELYIVEKNVEESNIFTNLWGQSKKSTTKQFMLWFRIFKVDYT